MDLGALLSGGIVFDEMRLIGINAHELRDFLSVSPDVRALLARGTPTGAASTYDASS
jgi:hypothetical protein